MDITVLGKEPIGEQNPTGEDVSYDPEFEQLEAEIEKLSSPTAEDQTNWKRVTELAEKILAEKSKDLRAASWLAVARLQGPDMMGGVAEGTRLFGDLIENFWDRMYPPKKRMRGRVGAIQWWVEKLDAALSRIEEPQPMERETLDSLKEDLGRLDGLLAEKLDEPPMIRSIRRFVDSIPVIEREEETPSEPVSEPEERQRPGDVEKKAPKPSVPAASAAAARTPEPAPAETDKIVSEKDARKVLRFGQEKLRQVASWFRENAPMDPMGYRCTRIAAWTAITSPPPSQDGQKTSLPPPDAQFLATVNQLREKGNYEAMISTIEGRISQYLFWLDLNRFTADALSSMGDRYGGAHDAVCMETAFFVHRVEGIENLAFQDGTPFADADTLRWLKSISLGSGPGMAEPVVGMDSSSGAEADEKMDEVIQKAGVLAGKKQFIEAVGMLQKELENSASAREAMLWRLALSKILIDSRKTRLVVPHLRQILSDIDKYNLEAWDPKLALGGLQVVMMGFGALGDKDFEKQADEALDRIARLDPAEALRVYKG